LARTILTVDDSVTMLMSIKIVLENAGYKVEQAQNGKAGLTVLDKTGRVDAIITDLNMPIMDGISFIKAVRQKKACKFTPIIMLTTEAQAAKKEEGRKAGATAWIVKPFKPEQLLAVLKKVGV